MLRIIIAYEGTKELGDPSDSSPLERAESNPLLDFSSSLHDTKPSFWQNLLLGTTTTQLPRLQPRLFLLSIFTPDLAVYKPLASQAKFTQVV